MCVYLSTKHYEILRLSGAWLFEVWGKCVLLCVTFCLLVLFLFHFHFVSRLWFVIETFQIKRVKKKKSLLALWNARNEYVGWLQEIYSY